MCLYIHISIQPQRIQTSSVISTKKRSYPGDLHDHGGGDDAASHGRAHDDRSMGGEGGVWAWAPLKGSFQGVLSRGSSLDGIKSQKRVF